MSYINETDFVIENKKLVYPEIVADGLQLYYDAKGKRDTDYHRDTMLDMSGNKNHGKLYNFAYEKHSGYKDGLVFDYIDDKLVRPTLNLKPNDFTFMLNGNIISFSPDGTVKRVQDSEVIESKGFNLVRNGDFRDGNSGWMSTPGYLNRFDVIGDIAVNREINTNNHRSFIYRNLSIPEGNIVYTTFRYKQNNITKSKLSILYSLSGVNKVGEYNVSGNEFEVYSAVGPYGSSPNFRILNGNIETDGNPEIYLDYLMIIDLTETFGSGNEPTKEQMDEIINRLGFIPNAQDLIDRIEYKGNDLGDMENIIDGLYKTEVLSGEEVYTDKADDDAVVHVEVDGKSYQHAGSGKNLFNAREYSPFSTQINHEVISMDGRRVSQFKTYFPTTEIDIRSSFKEDTQYTLQFYVKSQNVNSITLTLHHTDGTNVIVTMNTSYNSWEKFTISSKPGKTVKGVRAQQGSNGSFCYVDLDTFQLEEGSTATAYEPPAPTPDYPVEIHSLNDFDVVSSVGKRNYVRDMSIGNPDTSFSSSGKGSSIIQYDAENDGYYTNTSRTLNLANLPNGDYVFTLKAKRRYEGIGTYGILGSLTTKINLAYKRDLPDDYQEYSARFTQNGERSWNATFYDSLFFKELSVVEESPGFSEINLAPEDITENSNHSLIDKINLLLDEPLRSVENVKDKLFRDSDGVWKIERNVGEYIVDGNSDIIDSRTFIHIIIPDKGINTASDRVGNSSSSHFVNVRNSVINFYEGTFTMSGTGNIAIGANYDNRPTLEEFRSFVDNENPVFIYELSTPTIETLDQELQDKLNNLRSFEDSNYVYTVLSDENNILSNNLKPTLHAKFLYNNWYKEDRVINNLMIYNRALTNEEMLQNYKTIKRRWGM